MSDVPDQEEPPEVMARVRRVEETISTLLRRGVAISLGLVIAGAIVGAIRHPTYLLSATALERLTRTGADFPHTLLDVGRGLVHVQGQSLIALGLLLLIATPVMRVAVSIAAFKAAGDRVYTRITVVVLLLLLLSFFIGKVE